MIDSLSQMLATYHKKSLDCKELRLSAVLVPLFLRDGKYRIVFTRRSQHVAHHKGHISFPGGQVSPEDTSLLDTALRETWEEIGLKPEHARVLGELDDTPTITTGFVIAPFVALVPYPYKFVKNPAEIDYIFDVSIESLLHNYKLREESEIFGGEATPVYFYEYRDNIIWGATARILKQLLDMVQSIGAA